MTKYSNEQTQHNVDKNKDEESEVELGKHFKYG